MEFLYYFGEVATPMAMALLVGGTIGGLILGATPGLSPTMAVALLIPFTFYLQPVHGLILLGAADTSTVAGGAVSAILLKIPGAPAIIATTLDGHPMAKSGKAGKALAIAAYSSFSGGVIAALLLLVSAPYLASVSLSFQSTDYFALMVLGLSAVAAFAGKGEVLKALLMTVIGLMLSTVGTDQTVGVPRFTLGMIDLIDGISFLLYPVQDGCFHDTLTHLGHY